MSTWTRRTFVRAGAVASLGLSDLFQVRALAAQDEELPPPRADAVIQIHLPGGLAHQESFDPKPFAPKAYRGEVSAIDTKLPGVKFAKHLAQTAKIADRLTVIRSMTHGEAAHDRGTHNMLTGYRPSPAVVYPSLGSVVAEELGPRDDLPPYVCVPAPNSPYNGTGYMSASYAPFSLGDDPASKRFRVRDLDLPKGVDEERFARRRKMLEAVGAGFGDAVDGVGAMDSFYTGAYAMLASEGAKAAFRIDEEPDKLRDRYGRHAAGQRLLMARRLVEAGVRYVTVTVGGWDHHQQIARRVGEQLGPLDQAFAMLIRDLDGRGLLDRTLVLITTEFGRTPKVNPQGGRDHWPGVFSAVMAGGGVRRGYAHGTSDSTASAVESKAVIPEDLARTVYTLIGIDPDKALLAGTRPVRLVKGGRVLRDVLQPGEA
jgi:uncharacterized protein (DUF1501 family)